EHSTRDQCGLRGVVSLGCLASIPWPWFDGNLKNPNTISIGLFLIYKTGLPDSYSRNHRRINVGRLSCILDDAPILKGTIHGAHVFVGFFQSLLAILLL